MGSRFADRASIEQIGKPCSHFAPRLAQAGFDGVLADVKDVGRLIQRQPFHGAQIQDFTLSIGQCIQFPQCVAEVVGFDECLFWIRQTAFELIDERAGTGRFLPFASQLIVP